MNDLTHAEVKRLFDYDEKNGALISAVPRAMIKIGDTIGSLHWTRGKRYLVARVHGRLYSVHRLIWYYCNGEWPKNSIDHIDGDGLNNRIENLRDVHQQENMQNVRKANITNRVGVLGVHTRRDVPGKFFSNINVGGKLKYLGTFETAEAAEKAYVDAKRKLHPGCTI